MATTALGLLPTRARLRFHLIEITTKRSYLVSAVAGGRDDHVTSMAFKAISKGNSRFISNSSHLIVSTFYSVSKNS